MSQARASLDPQSGHVLRRFLVLFAFMALWSVAASPQHPLQAMVLMSSAAAAMDGLIAMLRKDAFNGAVLNYWDSTCAFFAINCLVRGVA
jgi:hypothetical protein